MPLTISKATDDKRCTHEYMSPEERLINMATHKYNYYKALEELMNYACDAAKYLDLVVNSYDPSLAQQYISEIHEIEHAADDKHHEITNYLFKD